MFAVMKPLFLFNSPEGKAAGLSFSVVKRQTSWNQNLTLCVAFGLKPKESIKILCGGKSFISNIY